MDNEYSEKKKIIQDLILKEEDAKVQLQRLVKLAKPFLSIEDKTGRVILKQEFPFTNPEKILVFLLGKYFAHQAGITKEETVKLSEISDGLGIIVTTLSAPMARLVKSKVVTKPQKDSYQISPFQTEKYLEGMQVYLPKEKSPSTTSSNPFFAPFKNTIDADKLVKAMEGFNEEKKNDPK